MQYLVIASLTQEALFLAMCEKTLALWYTSSYGGLCDDDFEKRSAASKDRMRDASRSASISRKSLSMSG
jgi:hypothetical protein